MPTTTIADFVRSLLGPGLPVGLEAYDGSRIEVPGAPARIVVRSPDAVHRILTAPGELGFSRAYVAGDLDLEGDVFSVLGLAERTPDLHLRPSHLVDLVRLARQAGFRHLPPPAEEAHLHGRRHSRGRDAAAVAHHYDVSNRFYETILGPSMTYSCAVFERPETTLEDAQAAKYELICRKLWLRPGMRLLDVGCGWGGMVMHAARHHGVQAVGVTVSAAQADYARRAVAEAGLGSQVEIRLADYRDVTDGPYDAISSIGMFEHVGASRLGEYLDRLHSLLAPSGRLLNHGITRPGGGRPRLGRRGFVDRYVFPDGELHEVGTVISAIHRAGLEVRHAENLREHYGRTLRHWVANLERNWDLAVSEAGAGRARVWRLYMAGSALGFEEGRIQIHQVLATRSDGGRSGLPLRPHLEDRPLADRGLATQGPQDRRSSLSEPRLG